METEIKLKTRVITDGTVWTVQINGIALRPKFKEKSAAAIFEKFLKLSLPGIAEAISKEMEK